ncbi:hypothetical protein BDV09DRAFT_200058 [Aspergillus tetrazonus]
MLNRNKDRVRIGQRELVGAFDVNGPSLLAVPYSGDLEMLPRSEFRGMSICWVVEHVPHEGKEDCSQENSSSEPVDNDSRMKWPMRKEDAVAEGDVSDGEGTIGSIAAGTDQPESESSSAADTKSQAAGSEVDSEPAYRVLNKVQGMWPILLDFPLKRYNFI